jgi:hypothetical protein
MEFILKNFRTEMLIFLLRYSVDFLKWEITLKNFEKWINSFVLSCLWKIGLQWLSADLLSYWFDSDLKWNFYFENQFIGIKAHTEKVRNTTRGCRLWDVKNSCCKNSSSTEVKRTFIKICQFSLQKVCELSVKPKALQRTYI